MYSDDQRRPNQEHQLVIDRVVSTQPELGPTIPDGGYGWLVFSSSLFFQAVIPSLTVSLGIFLAFSRLPGLSKNDSSPKLWDDTFMYTPILFISSWTIFDPTSRYLISNSTWPRLVATAGTCLTCAGLLFLWMGLAEYTGIILFPLAGIVCGIGASIQTAQCEILLAQYFRMKHAILANICQAVAALGFVVAPIAIGHNVLNTNLLYVIMWYQAIILQGLIFNLVFRKPAYLKSKQRDAYKYIAPNPEDEEDILSKNAKELQIKRQNSTGSRTTVEKHKLPTPTEEAVEPSSSNSNGIRKNWETFEDKEEDSDYNKYKILNQDWETFDDQNEINIEAKPKKNWVNFEDEPKNSENLQLELSLAEENRNVPTTSISGIPMPLFSDLPVNNNNTYSYDVIEDSQEVTSAVFMPTTLQKPRLLSDKLSDRLEILKQPTFYKSFLTVLTTKFSIFVYYSLFPLYIYQELPNTPMKELSTLIGLLSLTSLFFTFISHWINIDKKRRPICIWTLCWIGASGYFMIADSKSKAVLIFGAVQVLLSISTLQYVGMPILGLTIRGETNKEFCLISVMSGVSFIFFLVFDTYFRTCFKLMGLLHFFTGAVWFSNFMYKKFKV
ncbi:uncharacterized protein LOC130901885 isoform X1 [Diorhabda carinulata]|uniref:uncharacterized protein LOC130901885 isoform X1 n=2 Tax=Diorhabda carinulata TaxID=1163345 RepID=UPI0025A09CB8|nr:uncharacterized protein LOC130901885 isoform X1 [Diorhabda carinulata]